LEGSVVGRESPFDSAQHLDVDAPPALSLVHGVDVRRGGHGLGRRASLLVLAADAVALAAGATTAGTLEPSAVAFAAVAFVALRRTSHVAAIVPRVVTDLPSLLVRLAVSFLVVYPFASDADIDRLTRAAVTSAALVVTGRAAVCAGIRSARERGLLEETILVVGRGDEAERLLQRLRKHPEFGLRAMDLPSARPDADLAATNGVAEVETAVRRHRVTRAVIVPSRLGDDRTGHVVHALGHLGVETYVVARPFDLVAAQRGRVEELWGVALLRVRSAGEQRWRRLAKRSFDLVVGGLLLVVSAPVLAIAALAVRLSGPGPVLFRQQRIGQHGRPFEILKFRTLAVNGESDTAWSVDDDALSTPVGRFLRRTCLDELPQLLNVVRGDMSLVGPRPERPYFVQRFRLTVPGYDDRLRARPGITGWAQIHGLRGDTSIEERAEFDNVYIDRWTPWHDVAILARTVGAVMRGGPSSNRSPMRAGDRPMAGG